MSHPAFTPNIALASNSLKGRTLDVRRPATVSTLSMTAADKFMFNSQTREAKQAATVTGVYTVQCTEATGGANTAEATRLAVLAKQFRLRQASTSALYADLFATRRAAIISSAGSHVDESYAVKFPARAAAGVAGRAEKLRACSRYFKSVDDAEEYMFQCVESQYKAMRVPGGVYSTMCADGRQSGDADTARVSALATQFRAGQLSEKEKQQLRYDSSLEACFSGRGCSYEEEEYMRFPKMAGAIRWSSGVYASSVTGPASGIVGKLATVEEQIKGENLSSYWPSNEIRPAVKRSSKPWMPSPVKSYSAMSEAAVAYGVAAQAEPFKDSKYDGWSAGWKATGKFGI